MKEHILQTPWSFQVYVQVQNILENTFEERYFTVFCDNISLQYYKNLKIPLAQIARLTLKLLDFDFEIIYKKGK